MLSSIGPTNDDLSGSGLQQIQIDSTFSLEEDQEDASHHLKIEILPVIDNKRKGSFF